MKTWRNSIFNSKERKAIPIMTFPGLELTSNTVNQMVNKADVQYNCVKALTERYPLTAATTLIMDLSVEAEAFGCEITYNENEVPSVVNRLLYDLHKIEQLKTPEVGEGRTGHFLNAAQMAANGISKHPVFGGTIGPFSLAGRLYDISEFMMAILIDPDGAHKLLSICTDFLTEYVLAFKEAGADGVIIAEPAAGLLASNQCTEFSSTYIKEIVDKVQDDSFMVILHNCGNTNELVCSMLMTDCHGFHFGNAAEMSRILSQIPSDKIVMGNLDPVGIIKNETKETIKLKTIELLDKTSAFKNFILSSGCDIPPGTSLENIDAFFDGLNEFNKNKSCI